MLDEYLRKQHEKNGILLMTHIVLGYPSFDASFEIVRAMVDAGVDLMELQIPFSEPIADGPVILKANQKALKRGARVQQCIDFGGKVTEAFDIPFLYMTYCNILFRYGIGSFADGMATSGIRGAIVPDLPPEEGAEYLSAMAQRDLSPIFIFSPTTSVDRLAYLSEHCRGFVYCVARKGVTGQDTEFSEQLESYLQRCRRATSLPLAVGFGVRSRQDVEFLKGKADIAVIGSQTIRLIEEEGIESIGPFIRSLRP